MRNIDGQTGWFFFSVRLLSVLHGHSVFSSPPQRPMTSDFEGFSIPDFIHYIYFPILILEKEPVFSLLNAECQTMERLGYHFYNDCDMTRSLEMEPGTSNTRSQHSTTRLSKRRI